MKAMERDAGIHWRDFKNDPPQGSLKRRGVHLLTWRHNGNSKEPSYGFGLLRWSVGRWEWEGGYSLKPQNVPTYWAEVRTPDGVLAHPRWPDVPMFAPKANRLAWYRTQMIHVAEECLESKAAAQAWVRSPAFSLRGQVPWKVCVSKKGLQECVTALRRIDYNIAS